MTGGRRAFLPQHLVRQWARAGDLLRYGAALVGTAGSSGAQFVLTIALLRRMPPDGFGRYTFLMIVSQLVWGLGGALFAAPLAKLAAGTERGTDGSPAARAVIMLQPWFAMACSIAAFVIAMTIGAPPIASLVFAILVASGGLRQFLRIAGYSKGRQGRVVLSDALYTACVLALTGWLYWLGYQDLVLVLGILALAHVLGALPLIWLLKQPGTAIGNRSALAEYRTIWRDYAGWSLVGLFATETTGNAHSYIVTAVAGPTGFSAIAASTVLSKPATVAMNALSELERARMARFHAQGSVERLRGTRRLFRAMVLLLWLGTVVLTFLALHVWFRQFFHDRYDLTALRTAGWLWVVAMLIRCWCLPEAMEMQARGAFDRLAATRFIAAPISLVGSLLAVLLAAPEWSMLAICAGEGVSTALLMRAFHRLDRTHSGRHDNGRHQGPE